MHTAFVMVYRALVIYFVILIATRVLGKRELGQVSPFDFVVAIMLGELAVLTIDNTDLPMWLGIVPIAAIVIIHFAVAYVSMKSVRARALLSGRPTVLIQNGRIIEKNLASTRFNVNDLLGSLREKGIFDPNDVEFAILENTGKMSVQPRSQKRPATPADLGISTTYEGLAKPIIIDGVVQENYLDEANLTRDWLMNELEKQGISSEREVLLAVLNTDGTLLLSRKHDSDGDDQRPS